VWGDRRLDDLSALEVSVNGAVGFACESASGAHRLRDQLRSNRTAPGILLARRALTRVVSHNLRACVQARACSVPRESHFGSGTDVTALLCVDAPRVAIGNGIAFVETASLPLSVAAGRHPIFLGSRRGLYGLTNGVSRRGVARICPFRRTGAPRALVPARRSGGAGLGDQAEDDVGLVVSEVARSHLAAGVAVAAGAP
jgi:hypothetical protein